MADADETSPAKSFLPNMSRHWMVCLALLLVLAISMISRSVTRGQTMAAPGIAATSPASQAADTAAAYDPNASVSGRMWVINNGVPWWEFVLRGGIVYVFILVLLRLTGKRQVGQLAPFDLVLLLVLSNAVQNAMNGGDNSVAGGMISAVTLVGLNYFVGWMTFKSKTLEGLIEGHPVILVHNGKINHKAMNASRMTVHELNAALRAGGCAGAHEAKIAVLENGGNITVIRDELHHERSTHATHVSPPHAKPDINP